jgi:hypothetical protein
MKVCSIKKQPMKLGVSYNLFDGEELLEASIKSIRRQVEYINVVYQRISNNGKPYNENIENLLENLKLKGLVDNVILYTPDLTKINKGGFNEERKRFIGLMDCKNHRCTHFLSMDVDEFYRNNELFKAKDFILKNDIDCSAVSIIEYVKSPNYRLLNNYMFTPDGVDSELYQFMCPFICKIPRFIVAPQRNGIAPCFVDPTRFLINKGRFYLFPRHEISMHHMSTIRVNYEKKFENSTIAIDGDVKSKERFASIQNNIIDLSFDKMHAFSDAYKFMGKYPIKFVEDEFDVMLQRDNRRF